MMKGGKMGWLVNKLHKLGELLDRPLFYLDNRLNMIKVPAGIVLVMVGGWLISVALKYSALWYLGLAGGVLLLFGLLYLFLPDWLSALSRLSDRPLFSTDNFVWGARKSISLILIICALYIFFTVYLSIK
jgi:hypothetical protein